MADHNSRDALAADRYAILRAYLRYSQLQSERQRDELIPIVQKSPLTEVDFKRIVSLGPGNWDEVIRHHPGHAIEEGLSSLKSILDVFNRSWRDLSNAFDEFSTFASQPDALHISKRAKKHDIQFEVRKEMFTICHAAKALVDAARSLTAGLSPPGYRERINREFAENGQHRFISQLRDNLSHSWFAPADWSIKTTWIDNGKTKVQTTAFTLSSKKMLYDGDFTGIARDYILSSGAKINIRDLFGSYVEKVRAFYEWFFPAFDGNLPPYVIEYREVQKARKAQLSRVSWGLILNTVVESNIDPYDYLEGNMTSADLQEVFKLQHRSKEQVDKIISVIDENDACDDDLRKKIYKLFKIET